MLASHPLSLPLRRGFGICSPETADRRPPAHVMADPAAALVLRDYRPASVLRCDARPNHQLLLHPPQRTPVVVR